MAAMPGLDVRAGVRRVAFFAVVAVIAIAALATLPGVDEVRERLGNAQPGWIAVTAACSFASMLGFVRALWAAFDRIIPWRRALVLGFAEQGANVLLPAGGAGGPALGTLVLRRAGVPAHLAAQRHVALFLGTSLVSFVALALAGLGVSVGLLPGDVSLAATLIPAVVAVVVLVLALAFGYARPGPAPHGGRLRRNLLRARGFLQRGVRLTLELVRHGDPLFAAGAVGYYAFDVLALAASFQAFGGGAPSAGVFVCAYTLGHAGALLPTPGGVGGTEGGLIGSFVAYGAPLDVTAAAVLGYRVFQLGLPATLGLLSMVKIRRDLAQTDPAVVAARFAAATGSDAPGPRREAPEARGRVDR